MIVKLFFILLIFSVQLISIDLVKIYTKSGDFNVALILINNNCNNKNSTLIIDETYTYSAIWLIEHVNYLYDLKFGLEVYKNCGDNEILESVFDFYKSTHNNNNKQPLGVIFTKEISVKVRNFCQVLNLRIKSVKIFKNLVVEAALQFLSGIKSVRDFIVATSNNDIVEQFYMQSKKYDNFCFKEIHLLSDTKKISSNLTDLNIDIFVFFGSTEEIEEFLLYNSDKLLYPQFLFIPLAGGIPENVDLISNASFIILPPFPTNFNIETNLNIFPSPILMEIGNPLLMLLSESRKIEKNCRNSTDINDKQCALQEFAFYNQLLLLTPRQILKDLKIEALQEHFVYDTFKIGNLTKVSSYNIIFQNTTFFTDENDEKLFVKNLNSSRICSNKLKIVQEKNPNDHFYYNKFAVIFRNDSWIYALLSISLLGILFCLAILTFLLLKIFQKKGVLEGNPLMSVLLLFSVMMLFFSVLPFSIESTKNTNNFLCIIKSNLITLSYCSVFSLMLARCIMLSSTIKEIGFMSHISGIVQSFLCLFIIGVQAALNMHLIKRCDDNFTKGFNLIYFMSYNIMLILILLCLTPLIFKNERNYREAKYFTIAIILIGIVWSIWIPSYALLCKEFKEIIICLGLITTGGILLCVIFIPRTYLITIAAERVKITSTLPSNFSNINMDIYRAHSHRQQQPIYECINVAAINAATVARAPAANFYSSPNNEEINFELCCESSSAPASPIIKNSHDINNKVTRF